MRRAHMRPLVCVLLVCVLMIGGSLAVLLAAPAAANDVATVRQVAVLGGASFEVEITASQPITPRVLVITGPDRLVIDFPNALPERGLRNISVNRGEVKGIRVGLFANNPPVTRVVLDLNRAQPYQLFPSGKTVIIKLGSGAKTMAALPSVVPVASRPPAPPPSPSKPSPQMEVRYEHGRLSIWANRATLAEVLYELRRQTGADIPIPAGAEQEQVVASIGPAPAAEALAALLNGSRFNFIVVSSDRDPAKLKSVILTVRGEGISQPIITYSAPAVAQSAPEPAPPPQPETQAEQQPAPEQQPPQPEQPPGQESPPQ